MKLTINLLVLIFGLSVSCNISAEEFDGIKLATKPLGTVLAQSNLQQLCQQELTQLMQQLAQCTTDACRQQLQAAIAAHNVRCSNVR